LQHPPCRDTGWEFIWIYTLTTDTPPVPDPGEISEGRWVAPAELDAWMAREPKAFTPSFMLVWKLWREAKA
jgi:isopentenyldiphosphate isomerase